MKAEKVFYDKCLLILGRETEVLKKISALQELVWKAVAAREWADFESFNGAINALGGEFEVLEGEREKLLSELDTKQGRGDEKSRFYTLVSRFSPELRNELTQIYRNLKLEALKVRMSNDTLLNYLAEVRTVTAGFLEAAFPDRAGRLYTPQGTQIPADMRSVVLNRHF
jgi:hypothetical protein